MDKYTKPQADCSIQVENLTKSYKQIKAVDNISFVVKKSEIFGFLGPNGAGKTTTTRMITGVFPPDKGSIKIAGFDLLEQTLNAKMKMGVAPELANAYLDMTALENILFMAEMYGLSGKNIKDRAEQLLELFDLIDRKNDKIKRFSKGMKQRVVLSMALINDPEILFLDEPTSGLDVQSSRLIRKIIKELNQKGTTIFLTTHNIEEANKLCDRVAIMNKGRIAVIDSPENLKNTFQQTQSVIVGFKEPDIDFDKITEINLFEKRGDKYQLYTDAPAKLVTEIMDMTKRENIKLTYIKTQGPELEEVFIRLTGGSKYEK